MANIVPKGFKVGIGRRVYYPGDTLPDSYVPTKSYKRAVEAEKEANKKIESPSLPMADEQSPKVEQKK